ncbi:MOXD1 2 [Folsomia candida]|uniref:MOXD1 2 n=1 Tax=Folsomia candida TaxID=158441 RepID=A0A226CVX2_FOLCA|nr:MOXD1 2 [Folsomia candida]
METIKLLIFVTLCASTLGGVVPINGGKYILETRVTLTGILSVKITAETLGWDRYASHPGLPDLDRVQNVDLVSASENSTHTMLEFTRAVDTGDVDQDIKVERVEYISGGLC